MTFITGRCDMCPPLPAILKYRVTRVVRRWVWFGPLITKRTYLCGPHGRHELGRHLTPDTSIEVI